MTPSEPSATGGAIDDTYGLSGHSSGDETDIRPAPLEGMGKSWLHRWMQLFFAYKNRSLNSRKKVYHDASHAKQY